MQKLESSVFKNPDVCFRESVALLGTRIPGDHTQKGCQGSQVILCSGTCDLEGKATAFASQECPAWTLVLCCVPVRPHQLTAKLYNLIHQHVVSLVLSVASVA